MQDTPPAKPKPRILSGVQPSGKLHLGNYFGAVKQHIELQTQGECFYFIANYHALTTLAGRRKPACAENTRDVALDYLALGLDPDKAVFFRQSDVPEVTELAWILATVTNMGLLERAVSYKDKIDKGIDATVGLFTYPDPDGGRHSHLSVEHRPRRQGPGAASRDDRATSPSSSTARSTRTSSPMPKLSARQGASQGPRHGRAEDEQIVRQHDRDLRRGQAARKDGDGHQDRQHADGPTAEPGHLQRLRALQPVRDGATRRRRWPTTTAAGTIGYGDAKKLLKAKIDEYFAPFREKRKQLAQRPDTVEDILREGAKRARAEAGKTMELVRKATGL